MFNPDATVTRVEIYQQILAGNFDDYEGDDDIVEKYVTASESALRAAAAAWFPRAEITIEQDVQNNTSGSTAEIGAYVAYGDDEEATETAPWDFLRELEETTQHAFEQID